MMDDSPQGYSINSSWEVMGIWELKLAEGSKSLDKDSGKISPVSSPLSTSVFQTTLKSSFPPFSPPASGSKQWILMTLMENSESTAHNNPSL